MFLGFKSQQLVGLARDFERSDRELVPRAVLEISQLGRALRDDARQRLLRYAEQQGLNVRRIEATSVPGMRENSGILATNEGVYSSIGQTLPRAPDVARQRPRWSLLMQQQAIDPALGGQESVERKSLGAMEEASDKTLGKNRLN